MSTLTLCSLNNSRDKQSANLQSQLAEMTITTARRSSWNIASTETNAGLSKAITELHIQDSGKYRISPLTIRPRRFQPSAGWYSRGNLAV